MNEGEGAPMSASSGEDPRHRLGVHDVIGHLRPSGQCAYRGEMATDDAKVKSRYGHRRNGCGRRPPERSGTPR